ncbi:MAG: NYN domain-containing protein [Thermomicrobiales bacterium]|nr:NYN domain-containing protein [Thermomicrobiales bacterium]MCO5227794.1 NYN domain-containing protein [Thermomicrobiales bacterium]
MTDYPHPQRIAYYVDGFNLYHGCFDNTQTRSSWRQLRWLDIFTLCSHIYPGGDTVLVRYFTATVEPKPDNPNTSIRQQIYLRALRADGRTKVHLGRFSTYTKMRIVADPNSAIVRPKQPEEHSLVIESREKGSDVNLASYLLLDGFQNLYDFAVVVTNDSDLATPIKLVRDELGKQVAIVNPRKRTAIDLKDIAHSYKSIRRTWLENAQFPDQLQDEDGIFHKPAEWY